MGEAIRKLILKWAYRCDHKWVKEKEVNIYTTAGSKLPHTTRVVYRCTKCCEFKSKIL